MKTKLFSIIIAGALFSGGAINTFAKEAGADPCGPLPKNYQTVIRGYMSMPGRLLDPYSAVYRFEKPRKAWVQDGILAGHKKHFGWLIPTWINAKNAFGAYTGARLYLMFYFEDKIADETQMFEDKMGGFIP